MVKYLDDVVGDIVAALKTEGMYNNTLIVFSRYDAVQGIHAVGVTLPQTTHGCQSTATGFQLSQQLDVARMLTPVKACLDAVVLHSHGRFLNSDNGGPLYVDGNANNYPLRGGKYADFEGGVRTNAFVSGGYLPAARRGTQQDSLIHISDWCVYETQVLTHI